MRPLDDAARVPSGARLKLPAKRAAMKAMRSWPAAALCLMAALPWSGAAARDREHERLPRAVSDGQLLPLSRVLADVRRQMPGHDHIGTEFDAAARRYRLKFIGGGHVVWLDVDARTGRILGRMAP